MAVLQRPSASTIVLWIMIMLLIEDHVAESGGRRDQLDGDQNGSGPADGRERQRIRKVTSTAPLTSRAIQARSRALETHQWFVVSHARRQHPALGPDISVS
jgi:hypothetical protein